MGQYRNWLLHFSSHLFQAFRAFDGLAEFTSGQSSLLDLRIETKSRRPTRSTGHRLGSEVDAGYLFGYTDYRNANFGQIQIHERITDESRELLMQIKKLAEDMGFEVLHGIVDCLWVIGEPISKFRRPWRGRQAS